MSLHSSKLSLLSTESCQSTTTHNSQSTQQQLDKLRIIKPFDEKQLLNFYINPLYEANDKLISTFVERYVRKERNEYYELIVKLEKSIEKFSETKGNVSQFITSIEELEQGCWSSTKRSLHQTDRCSDGLAVEATHHYSECKFNADNIKSLDKYYYMLRERIVNDHVVHSYYQKFYQLKFELTIFEMCEIFKRLASKQTTASSSTSNYSISNYSTSNFNSSLYDDDLLLSDNQDPEARLQREQILDWLAALFVYYRKVNNCNHNLKEKCYQAIVFLCKELLRVATFEDRLFLLNQVLRCPGGSSPALADLIEPLNPLPYRSTNYELGKQYVDFGVTAISTILSPIIDRDKFIESNNKPPSLTKEPWLMVDVDFEDELVLPSVADITECDIINYLSRIPFAEMLEFMSLINREEGFDESTILSSTETSMIKLFAFNTRLILILRKGLQNFNCLRYKQLTLYMASMIKQIIKKISDNWRWCKEKFTTKDQALLVRLQVEFDHFMLRSITAILSTNRRGIWPLLAKIDFVGISEPMMWHILWVVYNNGRDDNSEVVSGLCPYMSANYWKDKFSHHAQWKYIFIEKLSVLSPDEASGVVDFFYNMAVSRVHKVEIDFLLEIIERIVEICLLNKFHKLESGKLEHNESTRVTQHMILENQQFYMAKGIACLVKMLNQFKQMIPELLNFISRTDASNCSVQSTLQLFTSLLLDDWKPNHAFFSILYQWLLEKPCNHLYNKLARILFSKLDWNRVLLQSDQCFLFEISLQRNHALKLYLAATNQMKQVESIQAANTSKVKVPSLKRTEVGLERLLELAQADQLTQFIEWCWNSLLILRIHPLDFIPDESSWDDIIFSSITRLKHRIFQNLPKINYETELVTLVNGMKDDNPLAAYITAMMTDLLFQSFSIDLSKLSEVCECLAKTDNYLAMLHLLYHFTPLLVGSADRMDENVKFTSMIVTLLQNGYHEELGSIILFQMKHFQQANNSIRICIAWTEILFESLNQCLNYKSNSWLSSFLPQFLSSTSSISNLVDSICEKLTKIFDRISLHLLINDNGILKLFVDHVAQKSYNRITNWKLNNLDQAASWFSLSSWYSGEAIYYIPDKTQLKSPWITPLHLLMRQAVNRLSLTYSPFYLAFVLAEIDLKRTSDVWSCLVNRMIKAKMNFDGNFIESQLKSCCQQYDMAPVPIGLLPINSIATWLVKFLPVSLNKSTSEPHPLTPLIWKQFFSVYFVYTESVSAVGVKFVNPNYSKQLIDRLNVLFDYHNNRWIKMNNEHAPDNASLTTLVSVGKQLETMSSDTVSSLLYEDRLVKLYRSYRIWLKDPRMQGFDFSINEDQFLKPEFQVKLLNQIFSTTKSMEIGIPSSPPDERINLFFLLNYVNKFNLQQNSLDYETYWWRLIKQAKASDSFSSESQSDLVPSCEFSDNEFAIQTPIKLSQCQYTNSEQFKQIIDYFTSLSSSLSVNLLLIDNDFGYNLLDSPQQDSLSMPDISVVIVMMHQIIDTVVEEARFVENQLKKFTELNQEFEDKIVPSLYTDVKREVEKKVSCEQDAYDASGCTGPGVIKFSFTESVLNESMKKKYDRNRSDFQSTLQALTEDIPVQKVVGCVYFMQKVAHYLLRFFDGDPKCEMNQMRIKQLCQTMSGWISSINSVQKYYITSQVLDQLLEILNSLSRPFINEVNYFLLQTALERNTTQSMIQQLAPCLMPSHTSPETFLDMYKLIGSQLSSTSQQTIFVLLSKFDVSNWLQLSSVTDEQRVELLECLYQCFTFFGVTPGDEYLMVTYDLYRKHFQDMILYRFPVFMPHILNFMLQGMDASVLAPALWNSVLHTFGFYTKSLSFGAKCSPNKTDYKRSNDRSILNSSIIDFDYSTFDFDLRTYTMKQKLFSSHELYDLMQLIINFNVNLCQEKSIEFLDYFKLYNTKYLQFISFFSYCWCSSNANALPDDLTIIWNSFFDLWKVWLFPRTSTKIIATEHLGFSWQLFTNCFRFLLDTYSDVQTHFLSFFWQAFLSFVIETEAVEKEDVLMFEEKLLQLPNWNRFYPTLSDIKLMYDSVLMTRYSVEKLNSFVISKIDWHRILFYSQITFDHAINVIDNLSYVLIALSEQPSIANVDLESIPFILLNSEQIKKINLALFEVMKSRIQIDSFRATLDTSQLKKMGEPTSSDVIQALTLFRILKALSLVSSYKFNQQEEEENSEITMRLLKHCLNSQENASKVISYAHCVGSFLAHICNNNVDYVAQYPDHIRLFLQSSIDAMKTSLESFDSSDRVAIFSELLTSINEIFEEPIRDKLCVHFVTIFSYFTSSKMIAELIISVGKMVYYIKSAVYLLECLIEIYFDLSSENLDFLVQNLEIVHISKQMNNNSQATPEEFIVESINNRSCLLLLLYLHCRLRRRTVPDICTRKYVFSVITQCANQLKLCSNHKPLDEPKVCFFWSQLFSMLTNETTDFECSLTPLNISIRNSHLAYSSHQTLSPVAPTSMLTSPISFSSSPLSSSPSRSLFDINNEELYGAIQTLFSMAKSINVIIADALNRGFLGFFRSAKGPSNNCILLLQCLVLHGICSILEIYFPETLQDAEEVSQVDRKTLLYSDSIRIRLKEELLEVHRTSVSRLRSWRKNKAFSEVWPQVDEMMQLLIIPKVFLHNGTGQTFLYEDHLDTPRSSSSESSPTPDQDTYNLAFKVEQFQLKRYQTIQKWLHHFYPDKKYMKNFSH